MVYDPETKSRLGLGDALYLALFPGSVEALDYGTLEYGTYRASEGGAYGRFYNGILFILGTLNALLNLLLTPLCFIAQLVSLPLLVPYWGYRWLFGKEDDPLHMPLGARIAGFPAQLLIWILSLPVKIIQIMIVLMAICLGPKD